MGQVASGGTGSPGDEPGGRRRPAAGGSRSLNHCDGDAPMIMMAIVSQFAITELPE
ncbi:hypothetical protein [Micromonospora tarensis]|uniref:Uncharacterized protein n=1 Tax=Micromonospora tarensis TaxID=2806100 RepID=A0ABS1YB24_9ACTN|nr:hypothetical protein [Micromonospora tarensis]MBM0274529.1 hypothetical protein [Micromonospora tarensis]